MSKKVTAGATAIRNPVASACKRAPKTGAGVHHTGSRKGSRSSQKARLRQGGE